MRVLATVLVMVFSLALAIAFLLTTIYVMVLAWLGIWWLSR